MADRDVILILGAARSGTSALTRVLSLCGCALPQSVLAPRDMNPKGFWEPVEATKLNLEFLMRHGMSIGDPSMGFEEEIAETYKEDFVQSIQGCLIECPQGPRLVIKCAGTAELFEFWSEAARRAGFSVKVVISFRRPQEVMASAAAASDQTMERLSANWIKINLLSERNTRSFPRVVVEYPNLLRDWRTEVARVSRALALDLEPNDVAVDSFLTPDLHRQRGASPIKEYFAYSWTTRIYSALSMAAQDGPIDQSSLDEIYEAYRANERAFRVAWLGRRGKPADLEKFRQTFEQWPVWRAGADY